MTTTIIFLEAGWLYVYGLSFRCVVKFSLSVDNWFYIAYNKHLFSYTEPNDHILLIQIHAKCPLFYVNKFTTVLVVDFYT